MKTQRRAIAVLLGIASLILLRICMLCFFDHEVAKAFFHLNTVSVDISSLLYLMGGFALANVGFQIYTIFIIWRGKREGYIMTMLCAVFLIMRGAITFFSLDMRTVEYVGIAAVPSVLGAATLILTWIAMRKLTN